MLSVAFELLPFDRQLAAGFYGPEGWGKEPVTSTARVNPEAIGLIFCPPAPDLCITGWILDRPIAMSNANYLSDHLREFPGRIAAVEAAFGSDSGTIKFARLQRDISNFEQSLLLTILKENGIVDTNKVAHRSGLMVLSNYSGKGYAKKMIEASDNYLRSKGITAVVVSPSWEGSRRVFLSQGYTMIGKFPLRDYGIELDDYNSYMMKIL